MGAARWSSAGDDAGVSPLSPSVLRVLDSAAALVRETRVAEALALCTEAFEDLMAKADHFGASNVAHMAGVAEPDPVEMLRWNKLALREADAVADRGSVAKFYASLYNNLAISHELVGDRGEATRCARLAWSNASALEPGPYAEHVRGAIKRHLQELESRSDDRRTRGGPRADV